MQAVYVKWLDSRKPPPTAIGEIAREAIREMERDGSASDATIKRFFSAVASDFSPRGHGG